MYQFIYLLGDEIWSLSWDTTFGDGAGDGDGDGDGNGDGGIIPPGFFLNFSLDAWDGGSSGDKTEGDGAE